MLKLTFLACALVGALAASSPADVDKRDFDVSLRGAVDPTIRELNAEFIGFRQLMDERDRRYDDRFRSQETAVAAALAAQEKLTNSAFAASKEAILKAEASQTGVNERSNEFRGQLADQAATLMPRKESEAALGSARDVFDREIKLVRGDISILSDARSESVGAKWAMGLGISIAGLFIALAMLAASLMGKKTIK